MENSITGLIEELKKYDNPEGYKLEYSQVKENLKPTIEKFIKLGGENLDSLYSLLENEETWSCAFALEILKEIKNKESIPYLISYIIKNEKRDYGDDCEDAMQALTNIGNPAIEPLMKEIRNQFEKKAFYIFLVGALTEIKNEEVYNFMKELTEDYIKNEEKYGEWFCIDIFTHDFDKQGKKEILPLLKNLVSLDRISKHEKIEINDAIDSIEDPEGYEQKLKEETEKLKPLIEKYLQEESNTKGKIDKKELEKRMWTPENSLEIQFKCNDCNKKQNINPGLIKILGAKSPEFNFESEILCKYCFSNNINPTEQGGRDILFQAIGTLIGPKTGVVSANEKVYVEGKTMPFRETYDYILKRIEQEPKSSGLYLRAGNVARNFNKYREAITHYEKAIELNPKLIAAYLNLVEIYEFRYKYYKIKDAKVSAVFYLNEMMDLFRTQDFDTLTLENGEAVIQFIGEKSESLGVYIPELIKIPIQNKKAPRKIGRNQPCPCGSGKKYKKCCLGKGKDE